MFLIETQYLIKELNRYNVPYELIKTPMCYGVKFNDKTYFASLKAQQDLFYLFCSFDFKTKSDLNDQWLLHKEVYHEDDNLNSDGTFKEHFLKVIKHEKVLIKLQNEKLKSDIYMQEINKNGGMI
jgi:hypothetical protein